MPTSTMPWWNAGRLLNQNRGVFGLNLLSWWRREGGMDRITRTAARRPRRADVWCLSSRRRSPSRDAGDAHRYLAERRNIGKVVLTPN